MKNKILIILIITTVFLQSKSKDYYYIDNVVLEEAQEEFGIYAKMRLEKLIKLMNILKYESEVNKVIKINKFFNDVPYGSDIDVWQRNDYWATTKEF